MRALIERHLLLIHRLEAAAMLPQSIAQTNKMIAAWEKTAAALGFDEHIRVNSDSDQAILNYLHSRGYQDAGPADVEKVRTYMNAHGLLHASEIGQ
jgi:hypothetical protein